MYKGTNPDTLLGLGVQVSAERPLRTHAVLRCNQALSVSGLQSPKIPWSQSSALGTCFQTRVYELFCLEHMVEGPRSSQCHKISSPVLEHSTGAGAEILGENHLPGPSPPPTPSERALPRPFSLLPFGSFLWPRATSSSSRPFLRSFFQNVSPAQCLAPLQPEATFRCSNCLCTSDRVGNPSPPGRLVLTPHPVPRHPGMSPFVPPRAEPTPPLGSRALVPQPRYTLQAPPSRSCHSPFSFFHSSLPRPQECFFQNEKNYFVSLLLGHIFAWVSIPFPLYQFSLFC